MTSCTQYVAPENPQCFCVEKCTEPNVWCDVCGFDIAACGGEGEAASFVTNPTGKAGLLYTGSNQVLINATEADSGYKWGYFPYGYGGEPMVFLPDEWSPPERTEVDQYTVHCYHIPDTLEGLEALALLGFHCCNMAADIVMAAAAMGAEELVAAIVAVYLHLAYMGAGSTSSSRGIAAGIITGGMSARLTLNRCHVAAVPRVVTFRVSLGIGAGGTCHGFCIAAVAMDMVAIQLHGDAPVIYGAFMVAAISTFFAAGM